VLRCAHKLHRQQPTWALKLQYRRQVVINMALLVAHGVLSVEQE